MVKQLGQQKPAWATIHDVWDGQEKQKCIAADVHLPYSCGLVLHFKNGFASLWLFSIFRLLSWNRIRLI